MSRWPKMIKLKLIISLNCIRKDRKLISLWSSLKKNWHSIKILLMRSNLMMIRRLCIIALGLVSSIYQVLIHLVSWAGQETCGERYREGQGLREEDLQVTWRCWEEDEEIESHPIRQVRQLDQPWRMICCIDHSWYSNIVSDVHETVIRPSTSSATHAWLRFELFLHSLSSSQLPLATYFLLFQPTSPGMQGLLGPPHCHQAIL